MPDIIITPNDGTIEFKPSSSTVNKIEASGNTFNLINTSSSNETIFNIEGTNGSLFSVADDLSGTLMSVNNNAGLPVFEVFNDDSIVAGRFNQNDFVLNSSGNIGIGTSAPTARLNVEGGNITFNDLGGSFDFRVEGVTDQNLLFIDASADDVGIGTDQPSEKLDINGSVRTRTGGIGHEDEGCYIAYPGGGTYNDSSTTQTGYLKITLPVSWTATMMAFDIDIYEYTTQKIKKFRVGGYNWSGSPQWINTSAMMDSDNDFAKYVVRFGHDGTKCAIYISEKDSNNIDLGSSTTWNYCKVSVSNFFGGWSSVTLANWADGWDVGFTTTLGTITGSIIEVSRPYRQHDANYVFNEYGGNVDFRVEGDSDTDLLFTDASTDRVGIGLGSTTFSEPTEKLDIKGSLGIYQTYKMASSEVYTSGAGSANGVSITLNQEHDTVLNTNFYYLVRLHTNLVGSGFGASLPTIDSGSSYLVWYNRSTSSWVARAIGLSGTTVEHPLLSINGSNAIAYTNSSSACRIYINVEAYYKTLNRAVPHYMGSDYHWQRSVDNIFYTDGNVGIGTDSPSHKLDINGTVSANSINVNDQFTFPTADGSSGQALVTDGSGSVSWTNIALNQTVNGRLTLESGVPISTTNQTAKTTLYFTPYLGNQIALYNGTEWKIYSFSELNLSLSGYTANTNYDIFVYNNSGTLTLESLAWTNNTTRATSLATQDGVYVKSGATTRRYLGTIRITGTTGQCEDSLHRRFLWNLYNQVEKVSSLNYYPGAPHTYTTSAWRSWNNNTTVSQTRLEVIRGLNESPFETKVWCEMTNGWSSIAIDSTSIANSYFKANSGGTGAADSFNKFLNIGEGYHYLQTIQYGTTGSTFYSLYVQASFLG